MTSGMLDSEPASLAEELEAAPAILHEEGILREEPEDDDRTASGLLDALVEATEARAEARHTDAEPGRLDRFLAERSPAQALYLWAGRNLLSRLKTRREIAQMLGRHVAHIDGMISEQLNAILHHPTFQRLESSWRGLEYLVDEADPEEPHRPSR